MKNKKIIDSYTCPVCMNTSEVFFETSKELQMVEENCPKCFSELKLSVWVINQKPVMLSVKARYQQLEWIQDTNGNLVLHHNGNPVRAASIPNMMINYSDFNNGELVEVNIEGLKKHLENNYRSTA